MFDPDRPLTELFPPSDLDAWKQKAADDLKGRPLEKLTGRTADGIPLEPLYTKAHERPAGDDGGVPGFAPLRRGSRVAGTLGRGPDLRVVIDHPDPEEAARQIVEALDRGATSLQIVLATSTGGGWTPGVHVDDAGQLTRMLKGAGLRERKVPLHLAAGAAYERAAADLASVWSGLGLGAGEARGGFGADPLGTLARDGELPMSVEDALAASGALARATADEWPGVRALRVDADFVHHAGGTTAQQLGTLLALGVRMLRACEGAGLPLDRAFAQIELSLRLDCRFFEQIAALRALRTCWSRVAEACGVDDPALQLHASPSDRVLTRRDPWVNMLRGTATTFAALVGGADAVSCTPFDAALGASGPLGRRVARNTGIILAEESHLSRVIDPAGGSWFLESLTDGIAEKAWSFFREIEAEGGAAEVIGSRWLRERVDASWQERAHLLRTRRQPVTGVSEYPDLQEKPVATAPAVVAEPARPTRPAVRTEPWPVRRDAAPFEELRDLSDAHLAEAGHRPKVFLATLGPLAAHTARATWIANLLAAGGIDTANPGALEGASEVAEAYRRERSPIAVLCSSDDLYETLAADAAVALKRAGARTVLLAGKPGGHEDAWRKAGVDRFVHLGVDVLALLRELVEELVPGVATGDDAQPGPDIPTHDEKGGPR